MRSPSGIYFFVFYFFFPTSTRRKKKIKNNKQTKNKYDGNAVGHHSNITPRERKKTRVNAEFSLLSSIFNL